MCLSPVVSGMGVPPETPSTLGNLSLQRTDVFHHVNQTAIHFSGKFNTLRELSKPKGEPHPEKTATGD